MGLRKHFGPNRQAPGTASSLRPARTRPDHRRLSPFFWLLVALSLVTLGVGLWSLQQRRAQIAVQSQPTVVAGRQPAADFLLPTADGATLQLSALRGKVVLLNFWATWCPPCQAEMPDLDALHRQYGAARGFTVIGLNVAESPETVQAFAKRLGLAFPLVLDASGEVSNRFYAVRSLPTSIIVDREGYVRDMWTGQISRAAMLARLERVW